MIINVPIYLEIDGRFTPEQGKEITVYLRNALNKFVREQSGGHFDFTSSFGRQRVNVLSEQQAINRFGTNKTLKSSDPGSKYSDHPDYPKDLK